MANDMRMSSFLPTIKCSMCAQEIEISMMGDHVCGPAPEPTPPLESSGISPSKSYDQLPSNNGSQFRMGRSPPSPLDTKAANRPFTRQDQLTPVSTPSESRSASPMTPNDGHKSPHLRAPGGGSNGHQSPEILAPNADSSFQGFPAQKSSSMNNIYQNRHLPKPQQYAEADPRYAPVSPRNASTGGLLKRMNTIAPGPFDVKGRRGPTKEQAPEPKLPPADFDRSVPDEPKGHSHQDSMTSSIHSHSSKASSAGGNATVPPIPIPTVERPGGYGGFGAQKDNEISPRALLGGGNRSNTFPNVTPSAVAGLPRRPSESTASLRRPSNVASDDNELDGTTFVRTSPPRDGSRRPSIKPPPRGLRLSGRKDTSSVNLDAEFGVGNPYHTPSMSQSSNDSGQSLTSKTSSRSSPPSSTEPRPTRKSSDNAGFDNVINDLQKAMSKPVSNSPPRTQFANNHMAPPRNLDPSLLSPESPMDPAIQGNRLSPLPPRESFSHNARQNNFPPQQRFPPNRRPSQSNVSPQQGYPPPNRRPSQPNPSFQQGNPPPMRRPSQPRDLSPQQINLPPMRRPSQPKDISPQQLNPPAMRRPSQQRPTTAKGDCKGCGQPIIGKSISSADGRLSGRYHKECFVCRTCRSPFATATFYVIADAPYCERHYHKLNNSCCFACDRGIEGQYLETERRQKFHPGCLTCADCRRVLRDDYFEMNGRVYCERDAFRKAQQRSLLGPGGGKGTNRMERRTTRLMMI